MGISSTFGGLVHDSSMEESGFILFIAGVA